MSKWQVDNITNKEGTGPVNFPHGFTLGDGLGSNINNIGIPGQPGFGVGICPGPLPAGFNKLPGTEDPLSDNYGNYIYSDGSITVWIPAYWLKTGSGLNGLAINAFDIKPFAYFDSVAAANSSGYTLPRGFYDGGITPGFFWDKYPCSNNNGVASSVKMGNPLSIAGDHNPISALIGSPALNYGGCVKAAKSRGSMFYCAARHERGALIPLILAQAAAAATANSSAFCAWYMPGANFPKGNNNNALGDVNDPMIRYISDGYSNCGKVGSANLFSRTTHNGQACGIADIAGNMWSVELGVMTIGTQVYVLSPDKKLSFFTTDGNTLTTDHWGAASAAANFRAIALPVSGTTNNYFGNGGNQVLSEALSGDAWMIAGLGFPRDINAVSAGGSAQLGNDYYYNQSISIEMCVISSGSWDYSSTAGPSAVYLYASRANSNANVSFRAACRLVG